MQVWNSKYSKAVTWDGDPQNAPDRCETCDGAGNIYWIVLNDLIAGFWKGPPPVKWILGTNNLPDSEECPECKGYGMLYYE